MTKTEHHLIRTDAERKVRRGPLTRLSDSEAAHAVVGVVAVGILGGRVAGEEEGGRPRLALRSARILWQERNSAKRSTHAGPVDVYERRAA